MTMLCKKLDKNDLQLFLKVAPDKWIANEKYDGDRCRLRIKDGKLTLYNRRGVEITRSYPEFSDFTYEQDIFIDGEMCVIDDNNVSQFNEGIAFRSHCKSEESIQQAMKNYPVTFMAFDLLEYAGEDIRTKPLMLRVEVLQDVLNKATHKNIEIVEFTSEILPLWNEVVCKGGEGIILKDKDSMYFEGKRRACWLKVKDIKEHDLTFVKYETHKMGITIETSDNVRITVNGYQSQEVKRLLDAKKEIRITIRHLGQTKAGKFRQPVFMKVVE